jgi:sugar/nucleoside kinase (ribokinase family)
VIDFLKDKGAGKIAITRGEEPVYFTKNGELGEIEVEKIKAIDTLGAGDFFHGAFCYFYAKNGNFEESLQKAARIATLSCGEFGTREWLKTSPVEHGNTGTRENK